MGALMAGEIEARLAAMGMQLPAPLKLPPGVTLPFPFVRIWGDRAFVSGHGALGPDGTLAEPRGRLGRELTMDQGYAAARLTALAVLASLKAALGDLDRVESWLRVLGMVSAVEGFDRYPEVVNGFTDLVVALYGTERGLHARSAIGAYGLPFGLPVEIEAEVAIRR